MNQGETGEAELLLLTIIINLKDPGPQRSVPQKRYNSVER